MKTKLFIAILSLTALTAGTFGLTACNNDDNDSYTPDNGNEQTAPDTTPGTQGLEYELSEDGTNYSVTGIGTAGNESQIIIPAVYNDKPVTTIAYRSFEGDTGVTSITIRRGVSYIDEAFAGCLNLTDIILPDNINYVGNGAFRDTRYYSSEENWQNNVLYAGKHLISAKTSISGVYTVKPETLTIGYAAFYGCENLTELKIPDSVTSINDSAFYRCLNLSAVNIPAKVSVIGDEAFRGCEKLTSITLPDKVKKIGNFAFRGCVKLTSIKIPDSVTSIGHDAFGGCTALASFTFGKGVTAIEYNTFGGCTSLNNVTIPENVTSIGNEAFFGCTSLANISLPDSIITIYDTTFEDSLIFNTESNWDNGVLYVGKYLIYADGEVSGNYEVKSGTLAIADSAFYGCEEITSISIPESVKTINSSAFYGCDNLTSITLPASLQRLGSSLFIGSYNLSVINYNGSKEQWQAIEKAEMWNAELRNVEIVCNNGKL